MMCSRVASLGAAAIFVFVWSTLARLGRSATSFGSNAILESIDLRGLWILYWIGTLLDNSALAMMARMP